MPFDTRLDKQDLWTLTDLLRRLPGVKSRDAHKWLYNDYLMALWYERDLFEAGAGFLPVSLGSDLFEENDWGTKLVTPVGAAALVEVYKAGHLPMTRKAPRDVPQDVLVYVASYDDLIAKATTRREMAAAKRQAHRSKVENPESVSESEFNYRLLDDIFIKHKGLAWQGSMEIGGTWVTKELRKYFSNTAKSLDWAVDFSWNAPTGELRTLRKPSMYENNRRNDPERDHGLYD